MSSVFKRRKFLKIGSQCANILLNVVIRIHFFGVLLFEMDYVPKLAKNNLDVVIKGNCRVKIKHVLVYCVLVLSIAQLLLIFLMICDLYGCSNLNV